MPTWRLCCDEPARFASHGLFLPPPMSLHNFQSTFAGIFNPLLSGVVVSTGLWGLIVGQTWTYFNSTQDGWLIRVFVGVVVAADTALTCVTASIAQHYLIQQFGDIVSIVSTRPSSVFAEYAMNLVIVTLVGLFLAHRVLTRGRNWIITIIITVFTAAHFIAGIFFLVEIKKNTQAPFSFSSKEKLSLLLANAFATIFTLAFAGYLSWQIYAGRAGMKLTGSTLSILSYTVATGSLVAVLQLLNLALCTTLYAVQWWPVHFFTCKFYVLTMVVILNTDLAFACRRTGPLCVVPGQPAAQLTVPVLLCFDSRCRPPCCSSRSG
ncbi:hypothetical protein C8J57DRAFT_431105 [Mycena rebaudengoi]|nr:hypothetical protein C8J57DRAFT_431105 [Mycena rebaudengoi]